MAAQKAPASPLLPSRVADAGGGSSEGRPSGVSKLVFGLNPRAHRTAVSSAANESRKQKGANSGQRQQPDCSQTTQHQSEVPSICNKSNEARKPVSDNHESAKQTVAGSGIRASKYGNFYKPQDLITTQKDRSAPAERALCSDKQLTNPMKPSENLSLKQGQSAQADAMAKRQTAALNTSQNHSNKSPSESDKSSVIRSRSRSPERVGRQMARRKSFDDDISTIKTELSGLAPVSSSEQQPQPQQPILKTPTRTQFNIRPPPQLALATTGKHSVVGYAKSRIYDKPAKQILANPIRDESIFSALDDRSDQIPVSILCGFKPPKQVNVSKAREKWEGGEPFVKCKSRKRLAAQANKKLIPGVWSMTSVVATQQLHLQQALAQSSARHSSNPRSNPLESDPSVKVLQRGSVLERVQQFEKVPGSSGNQQAGSGLIPLSVSSSLDSFFLDRNDDSLACLDTPTSVLESSSSLSSLSDVGPCPEAELTIGEPTDVVSSSQRQLQNKQTLSNTSVSSIQNQREKLTSAQASSASSETSQNQACQHSYSKSSTIAVPITPSPKRLTSSSVLTQTLPSSSTTQQRKLSLRRRSFGRSSTSSLIPKFYHQNGKANTYEIEIKKRDIIACFEKLPEQKAQLTTTACTTANRKHFHLISIACGYSKYFEVPLQLYVRYKLETNPKLTSAGVGGQRNISRQRKSSTVALNTNGISSSLILKPLLKSASIDSSPSLQNNTLNKVQKGRSETSEFNSVTCEQFLVCWKDLISNASDNASQFVHLLTLGQRQCLIPDDFVPLIQSIIDDHPGLKFLRAAPDFHMRYIQTVIARIFFCINRSWTGKISLQELRKSNFFTVLHLLSQEEDINQIIDYFSYEHFYVIYCKFWNLDQDHDLFISREDLARHNDAAISSRIIERIFSGIVSKQIQKTGKMSYSDFVWFLIAEEDKKHPRSIEYWFRLMDLDGDGYISMYEMEYFYFEQTKRLELMNIEPLPFLDSACQILDLVNPREPNKISLADLKRTKMAPIFFDTFINLEKYLEHESREFVSTRDVIQGGVVISDWVRYASEEYENLVTEESAV